MEVSDMFQGCFKELQRVFQGSFMGVSRKIEGCFNGVLSLFQACLNEVEWVFEGSFQSGVFKENVKCVSRKFHKKFQGCLKFCFAILL